MSTHFYNTLLSQVSDWQRFREEERREMRPSRGLSKGWEAYRAYTEMLTDSNTRRLLFDSRQAVIFGDLAEPPPEKAQYILHTPFDQFYLELTEPILLGEQETNHQDYIRAFLYSGDIATAQAGEGPKFSLATISVFLTNTDTGRLEIADRTWKLHLQTGMAFVSAAASSVDPDPSELGTLKRTQSFLAGHNLGIENRHIGWWERLCIQYTALWSWMMLYCMAKGIYLEQEWLSRQQRRWLEQHPKAPRPWHLVKVEPKFTSVRVEGEGSHHSYRYDVIGHLRFANVRVVDKIQDDGTKTYGHKSVVEWIPPHQRGLANTLYIPKTYQVEAGKTIHPKFREYANSSQQGV